MIDLSFSSWSVKAIAASVVAILWVHLATGLGHEARWINPDFEEGEPGQVPAGWVVPKMLADQGFTAVLTAEQPASGRLCAGLRWPATAPASGQFANLMQRIDATTWRGKRIVVTAAVRVASSGAGKQAQMWLRVDRPDAVGAFDNMANRPIKSVVWQDYSITADVADDAVWINLGLMTLGGATGWWDHIRVEVAGQFTTLHEPPRPLDAGGLANLVALTRLMGYVRHFHPSDAAASADWLAFAVGAVQKVEHATDAASLAAALQAAFDPVAPTVRVFEKGKEPSLPSELQSPAEGPGAAIRVWEHVGYCPGEGGVSGMVYTGRRLTLEAKDPASLPSYGQPSNVFKGDLGGGVGCWVPSAVFADSSGTLPHTPQQRPSDPNQPRFSVTHRRARLATVMLGWNVLNQFYPYLDVVGTDLGKELEVALTAAATDANEAAFFRTLNRLAVALHDGHSSLTGPGMPVTIPLQARVEWIADKVVVTGVPPEAPGLRLGDVIERIEGRIASEVFHEIAAEISSATAQWRAWKAAQQFGPRPWTDPATVEVRGGDGDLRTAKVRCSGFKADDGIRRLAKVQEVRPGIWYVDVTRLAQADWEASLVDLAKATGLVFDLRGYPMGQPQWLGHLSGSSLQSASWNIPQLHRPDRTDLKWITPGRWNLQPRQPQLTAHLAFLTDGSTISYGESVMGIIEAYELGPIVGGPTAGTNGNINSIELPLGYTLWFTGMKVLKHDGSQHHGVGIKPTVPVAKTIRGVRDGRDEQLERALTLVSRQPGD